MAADLPERTKMIKKVYNQLNKDTSFVCRVNDHDLTAEQNALWSQLSKEIIDR